jgi:hypothetical protein
LLTLSFTGFDPELTSGATAGCRIVLMPANKPSPIRYRLQRVRPAMLASPIQITWIKIADAGRMTLEQH